MVDRRVFALRVQGLGMTAAMGLAALVMGQVTEPAPGPDIGQTMPTLAATESSPSAPEGTWTRMPARGADHGPAPRASGRWRTRGTGSTSGALLNCPAPRQSEVAGEVTAEVAPEFRAEFPSRRQPPPLFDADGLPLPPLASALPTRGDAFTRQGLYATEAQLAWEELVVAPYTVVVEVASASAAAGAIDQALRIHRSQALPSAMGYFVRSENPALAAQVADCLADEGLPAVFVVARSGSR